MLNLKNLVKDTLWLIFLLRKHVHTTDQAFISHISFKCNWIVLKYLLGLIFGVKNKYLYPARPLRLDINGKYDTYMLYLNFKTGILLLKTGQASTYHIFITWIDTKDGYLLFVIFWLRKKVPINKYVFTSRY